ncbi:MAG: aminotransferase class I/II-fold pyridoxal phosphate-dependent enzyme [Thiotrichaceae bacterium]
MFENKDTHKKKAGLFGLNNAAKDKLAQKMLQKRLKKFEQDDDKPIKKSRHSTSSKNTIPDEFTRFDQFPGYQQIRVLAKGGEQLGIPSPFFKVHESVASNTTQIGGKEFINYASYNYLDLCGHPRVSEAAKQAIEQYGTSSSASRPVAGERPIQRELEQALADVYGVDDCVAFVSGHATNVTTIGYLFGRNDLILHDALIHNSVLQGIQLSGAKRIPFAHNDWQALDDILSRERNNFERVLIVIEGIYSMDGDYPDLPKFIDIKQRHKAFLMVDEAHALGIMGETGLGIREHFDINGKEVDIWMGTLSKTLASCGGYIAGEKALVEHLKYYAPGFLYSVGIPPSAAAASLAAIKLMLAEPTRISTLKARSQQFLTLAQEKNIDTGLSEGFSVIPVLTGSSARAGRLANTCFDRGINVQPIFYPAVQEKMARLRFFICSSHTEEQITHTVNVLAEEI